MNPPTPPVMQHGLEEEQSEKGNYSRTVSQTEPQKIRRNNPDDMVEITGCKYMDF